VTRVAREVGTEGKLGGQAQVPGVAGTWKDLTGNVNCWPPTSPRRCATIAEVATAVTKGDLTRSIARSTRCGEVAELKDNINTMIDNLRLTTERNTEQDWLKTNLAKFTNMLQGQRDLGTVGRLILSELTPLVDAHQGVIYQTQDNEDTEAAPEALGLCRLGGRRASAEIRHVGQGLVGQCAADRRRSDLRSFPTMSCRHPIGAAAIPGPIRKIIMVLPVLFEGQVKAVIELGASVSTFTELQIDLPRTADVLDRHRAELDRSDDADRRAVEAVAAARGRAPVPTGRAAADQRTA
jgi:HAMP domain-containing protein